MCERDTSERGERERARAIKPHRETGKEGWGGRRSKTDTARERERERESGRERENSRERVCVCVREAVFQSAGDMR